MSYGQSGLSELSHKVAERLLSRHVVMSKLAEASHDGPPGRPKIKWIPIRVNKHPYFSNISDIGFKILISKFHEQWIIP